MAPEGGAPGSGGPSRQAHARREGRLDRSHAPAKPTGNGPSRRLMAPPIITAVLLLLAPLVVGLLGRIAVGVWRWGQT